MPATNDPLVDAILDPLRELLGRYRALSARLSSAMQAIETELSSGIHQPVAPVQTVTPAQTGQPIRPTAATLETHSRDLETLLDFQEHLSEIPGVLKVTVTGTKEGHSTFLIELEQEIQSVVCANCGKTLTSGKLPPSHGLCDDCRANYGAFDR